MPIGAEILDVQLQNGVPVLWALIKDTEKEDRRFILYGTGWDMPGNPGKYVATVQQREFVWHVFETTNA